MYTPYIYTYMYIYIINNFSTVLYYYLLGRKQGQTLCKSCFDVFLLFFYVLLYTLYNIIKKVYTICYMRINCMYIPVWYYVCQLIKLFIAQISPDPFR